MHHASHINKTFLHFIASLLAVNAKIEGTKARLHWRVTSELTFHDQASKLTISFGLKTSYKIVCLVIYRSTFTLCCISFVASWATFQKQRQC